MKEIYCACSKFRLKTTPSLENKFRRVTRFSAFIDLAKKTLGARGARFDKSTELEILENRLNGLIVKRNSVRLFALKWSKKNAFSCYPTMKVSHKRCQAELLHVMCRYSQQLLENCIEFLSKEMPDIKIDDNCLFEEIRRMNAYLNSDKLEQLEN
ncbi:hypothetical protein TNCV_2296001 [Trichonephila clavipes]|nr:hypothetical protein TNCV_2296001 [Trichonephila clavipes]